MNPKTNSVSRLAMIGLSSIVVFSGCSRLDLALRWADTFVMSQITDYFELTSVQKEQARGEFKTALNDIQKLDFPNVVIILRALAEAAEKNLLNEAAVDQFLKGVEANFKSAALRFEPMAQKIVSEQVPSNFKLFDKEYQRKFDRDAEKDKNPKKRRQEVEERVQKFVDETVGYLTKDQIQKLSVWQDQNPPPDALRLASRTAVFEKFKAVRGEEKTRTEFIHKFFAEWETLQTKEYIVARDLYRKKSREIIIEILGSAEEKQRANMVKNLRARADELEKISKK